MNAAVASLFAAALKAAGKAAKQRLQEKIPSPDWLLEGNVEFQSVGKNLWHATIDPADPIRLRHVPTGRCICPAVAELDTDLSSIPSIIQKAARSSTVLHLQRDSFPRSAIIHDALYGAHWCWAVLDGKAFRASCTRAQADAILYLCLASEGATVADGLAYFSAVRAAGAPHWRLLANHDRWPPLFSQDAVAATHIKKLTHKTKTKKNIRKKTKKGHRHV